MAEKQVINKLGVDAKARVKYAQERRDATTYEPVKPEQQWGFIHNNMDCIGCRACAGLDEGVRERVGVAQVHHVQRPAGAVKGVGAALVVLCRLEHGQHVGPAPAGVALGGPGVVVLGHAARIDHGVDRAGAAQHLAARLVATAAVQARLRHGLKGPVEGMARGGRTRHHAQPGRAVNQHAGVGRAGLQQRHLHGRVFGEARGQHAAGRAGAHDHDIHALAPRFVPPL